MPNTDTRTFAEQTAGVRALGERLARQSDDEPTGRTAVRGFQ